MANYDGTAKAMAVVPVLVVTVIWVIVGAIVPCFMKGPNKRLIQTMLVMTAVCCWLFWVCAYFCQLNPLIGPEIKAGALKAAVKEWGGKDV